MKKWIIPLIIVIILTIGGLAYFFIPKENSQELPSENLEPEQKEIEEVQQPSTNDNAPKETISELNTQEITNDQTAEQSENEGGEGGGAGGGGAGAAGPSGISPPPDTVPPPTENDDYEYDAVLTDVTGGEQIYTVETGGIATGFAYSKHDTLYEAYVEVENLPITAGPDEYVVWIAKVDGGFSVKKLGTFDYENNKHVLTYTSLTDYTDHNFIVVTIEPDSSSTDPGDHILDGQFTLI